MKNEWDDYAGGWEDNHQVIEYSELAFKSLLETIDLNGLQVLDFGSGTGLLSEQMSSSAKNIVALDNSSDMCRVLKGKGLENVAVIDQLLTSELINNNLLLAKKFDLIVASSVCGFLPDYTGTLKLFKSMLKPDGLFVQWDWLVQDAQSEMGLSKAVIEASFQEAKLELTALKEPFAMEMEEQNMPVVMAVGKNSL